MGDSGDAPSVALLYRQSESFAVADVMKRERQPIIQKVRMLLVIRHNGLNGFKLYGTAVSCSRAVDDVVVSGQHPNASFFLPWCTEKST